jgi:hypothetical protein
LDQILLRAESGNVPTRTIFAFDETIFAASALNPPQSHGSFQEPFTGQKPFSKRPDPPRARDGLATCTGAYGANDQLTNVVACAWFELHPNLR